MASVFLNLGITLDYDGADYIIVQEEQMIPKTHEYLFHYLEVDFSRLEAYSRSYLACVDMQEPENSSQGDSSILQRIFEELFALHPYFRACPSGASAMINVVFAGFVRKVIPNDTELQVRIMNKICTEKYLGEKNAYFWLENAMPVDDDRLFDSLYELQQNISRWAFLALDNTNPDLAKLTSRQRNAVYSLIFGGEYVPLLETRVEKNISRPHNFAAISAALDFDQNFMSDIFKGIADMQKDPSAPVPDSIRKIIEVASQITEDCERHTYLTETLEDLLKYEVYGMTQTDIRIKKCKYCGRYFILEKGNIEYCDRIVPGETKPCNEIGKSRTYEQRITNGSSVMALYRKAYKTHFARIRSGTMTKEEFDLWKANATNKRQLVESGELDFNEFATWLKQ